MSVHDGHRQRLKQRFLETGLDSFTEVQTLELLLFYAIARKDTNPIAHALLDRFGSLAQVLDAPVTELSKVPGIGENAALLLRLSKEMGRRYLVSRTGQVTILSSLEECASYIVPYFYGRELETVFLLCLDAKCKVLCCKEIGEGSVNATEISVRKIVEMALAFNASSVVLAHNHPSGLAIPSEQDLLTTKRIAMALGTIDVTLADHIIVADDDYVSLAQSGQRFHDCLLT